MTMLTCVMANLFNQMLFGFISHLIGCSRPSAPIPAGLSQHTADAYENPEKNPSQKQAKRPCGELAGERCGLILHQK